MVGFDMLRVGIVGVDMALGAKRAAPYGLHVGCEFMSVDVLVCLAWCSSGTWVAASRVPVRGISLAMLGCGKSRRLVVDGVKVIGVAVFGVVSRPGAISGLILPGTGTTFFLV